jgi:TP901 family phage tail tape measure protein
MNAMLNIVVRVNAQQAQAMLKAQEAQLRRTAAAANGVGSAYGGIGGALRAGHLEKFGKNLQWTGRQLEYSFTLPLLLAGAASTKWALENEAAATKVRKVYGDLATSEEVVRAETDALSRSFELLSSRFGVHQQEVIEIGAAWAQAGAQGVAVANMTRATLEAMIIGEMDHAQAVESLIAVQSAYRLNSEQLHETLAELNIIENETAISFSGLIDVIRRAGGVAREFGIEARELGALGAVLVPVAGTAAQAGNGLKSMLTSIMSPTGQAADLLAAMGVNIEEVGWQSLTATERLFKMSDSFEELSQSQQAIVGRFVAARWQINRFSVLMEDLAKAQDTATQSQSVFMKAMDASDPLNKVGNQTKALAAYTRELNTYLTSSPQRFQILTRSMQNALAKAIMPLLPTIIALLARVTEMVIAFSELDPAIQQVVLGALLLLAVIGPLGRYIGVTAQLVDLFARGLGLMIHMLFGNVAASRAFIAVNSVENLSRMQSIKLLYLQHGAIGLLLIGMWKLVKFPFVLVAKGFDLIWGAALLMGRGFGLIISGMIGGLGLLGRAMVAFGTFMTGLPRIITPVAGAIGWAMGAAVMVVGRAVSAMGALLGLLPTVATAAATGVANAFAGLGATFALLAANWPIVLGAAIVAGVMAAMLVFRDEMDKAVSWVIENWNRLPEAIGNALIQAVIIVRDAALAIYEWLSYINPFARHSPSLVDSVQAGVSTILDEYSRLRGISSVINSAANAHRNFMQATRAATQNLTAQEYSSQREEIVSVAPSAGPAVDALIASIRSLYASLSLVGQEIAQQEPVVARWEAALKRANDALDVQEFKLDRLRATAEQAKDALSAAEEVLDKLVQTPIAGMGAMADAIFANEMAQKRLRLEMLRLEEVNGPLDDLKDRLAALQGDIETLTAEQNELRFAGAGSDVLGFYDDQIDALERQREALWASAEPIEEIQNQLEELERQGEILNLENSLQFDPLLRQIDQVVNAMDEMPFDQLYSQIVAQQAEVDRLTTAWEQADAAMTAQQAVVDQHKAARDALAAVYDRELDKLQALESAYSDIESQIRDMEQAMSDFVSASQAAKSAAAGGAGDPSYMRQFEAAAGGDFPVPGGDSVLGREGGLKEIEEFNRQLEEELNKAMEEMGSIDLFAPFKEMWNTTWGWIKDNVGPVVAPVWESVKSWWNGLNLDVGSLFGGGEGGGGFFDRIKEAWNGFTEWIKNTGVSNFFRDLGNGIGDFVDTVSGHLEPLREIWDEIWKGLGGLIGPLWEEFQKSGEMVDPLLEALGHVVNFLGRVLQWVLVIGGGILAAFIQIFSPIVRNVIEPVFSFIAEFVGASMQVVRGVIMTILNIINGDWGAAWDSFVSIFGGIWDEIFAIFRGAGKVIWGVVSGIVEGIWDFFVWLYDVLVGHSIIPDLVNAIIDWFKLMVEGARIIWNVLSTVIRAAFDIIIAVVTWAWQNVLQPIFNAWWAFFTTVLIPLFGILWNVIQVAFTAIVTVISWAWSNVIQPILSAWWDYITNVLIPVLGVLWSIVQVAFNVIVSVISWAWNNVIQPIFNALHWFISEVLIPVFRFLWNNVIKPVWNAISAAIRWAWENVIQPVFRAVADFIVYQLGPKFNAFKSIAETVWRVIRDAIKGAWNDHIKPIWEAIKRFIDDTLMPKFRSLRDTITGAWDTVKEKTATVFNSMKDTMARAINVGIRAVNKLIDGLNTVADILPGLDWNIPDIPTIPGYASGGRIEPTATRVGGGFASARPRAIVSEGSPFHKEYVVPTDPRYRNRAVTLAGQLMGDLGMAPKFAWGGILPSPSDIVGSIGDAIGSVRRGAVDLAFKPFDTAANALINQIDWLHPRKAVGSLKEQVKNWVKGADENVNSGVDAWQAAAAAATHTASGLNPEFLGLFNRYNHSLGYPFTITSGWRSYEEQVRLYNLYLAGIGNLAAKPGTSNHEKGFAIDHSPSSNSMQRARASVYGLHYPVMPSEPWHVEPKNIAALAANWNTGGGGSAGLRQMVQQKNAARGWMMHWSALDSLIQKESSWNPNAQNPTSSAYGLFQFLNSTWSTVGGRKTSDAGLQTDYGLRYIGQRYGNPSAAWAFHRQNNWYSKGAALDYRGIDASMARGGTIIKRQRDGLILNVGEGRKNEKVQVLPLDGDDDGKKVENHFHGDFVFPNITSGKEAKRFLENLSAMVDD